MSEEPQVAEEKVYFLEKKEVFVDDFEAPGLILAIGGGGEGVIGQLKGTQVVAIDPNIRELKGAVDGPLKVKMDAGDMQFLDASFGTATSFFTLMYIKGVEHEKVFKEVYRVLAPQGRFLVWDVNLPTCLDETKEFVALYLNIKLPDRDIETGYGIKWPAQVQNLAHYIRLAESVGFVISEQKDDGQTFFLESQKP